jgi:hypothetical protein
MICGELDDVAAELALGALTGRERAQALAHLHTCEECPEVIRRLMTTAEQLPALLVDREPPPGFEDAVLARIGLTTLPPAPGHRGGKARLRCLAAADLLAATGGAGLAGWSLRLGALPPSAGPLLASAALVAPGHRAVGQAFAYRADPGWVYVSVDLGSGSQAVTCQVVGPGGRVTAVGTFWLADGRGSWGGPVPAGPGWPAAARLVTPGGTVVAVATFTQR